MADDFAPAEDTNWGPAVDVANGEDMQMISMDLPEVKLFGKWSLNDVEVTDASLVVCFFLIVCISFYYFLGLYCC